jgi:hypothetical protein
MSSSIAQQKAYVESLDRKAVEDGLRNGHPIIAQFLFADRAKRMQQNDTAIEALEKAAGIPEEGQDIATKLADYLARGGDQPGGQMPGGQMPGGQPGGQMPGMPGQGPGGPMAPGMPMNAAGGGLIPRYQDRGLVEDDDEYRLEWGEGYTPEGTYSSGERSIAGDVGRLFKRGVMGTRGAVDATQHGINTLIEAILPGQQYGGDYRGSEGQLLARRGIPGLFGEDEFYDPSEVGWSGRKRKVRVEGEPATDFERTGGGDGTTGTRDPFGFTALTDRLDDMRTDAMKETGAEADLRRGREAEAQRILNRKETIQDLLPTAEQDKLRREGTFLGELSDVLGRRRTAPGDSGFGSIGKAVRDYDANILQRDLATEELMAGLDSKAYGVTDQTLAELARLSRAGTAYDDPEFKLMLAKYEADRDAAVEAMKQRGGLYKPSEWDSVLSFLESPDSVGLDPSARAAINANLTQSMLGGGVPKSDPRLMNLMASMSEEEREGLMLRMAKGFGTGAATFGLASLPLGGVPSVPAAVVGGTLNALRKGIFGG